MTMRTSFAVLTTSLLITAGAWAAVPQSLSYQGYLTDRIGSPITDSQTITFGIYTVPVDGVPIWQETKSVAFANGLFSVRLGELIAFPPDLFDVPLWLGMTIGTDSEMEPRRPLTTAGFSFRAEDADGLQGRSAAELDQSLHVDDDANPHIVTAVQTGAATVVALDTHAINTGNPHSVSVGQTGGTSAATFGTHAAEPVAHHTRYADAEALATMGAEQDSNPLNHARYANAEAVSAVMAVDGEGSGFDADLVDGMQATEIINAAAGADAGNRYEFVGFSASTVNGAVGWLGLSQACQSTFGSESKMSTTAEIIASTSLAPGTSAAWVNLSQLITWSSGTFLEFPSTVVGALGNLNCGGWRNAGTLTTGLIVDSTNYTFSNDSCSVQRPIACSVPATVGQ